MTKQVDGGAKDPQLCTEALLKLARSRRIEANRAIQENKEAEPLHIKHTSCERLDQSTV
jgi:hypothetical protein